MLRLSERQLQSRWGMQIRTCHDTGGRTVNSGAQRQHLQAVEEFWQVHIQRVPIRPSKGADESEATSKGRSNITTGDAESEVAGVEIELAGRNSGREAQGGEMMRGRRFAG